MFFIFNIVPIGTIILILYILIDFYRKRTNNLLKRIVFYSFIFYLLNVAQLTTGGIVFPPQQHVEANFGRVQFIPFYFIWDFFEIQQRMGFNWFFWNAVKLSFYNMIMLFPLGVYLSIMFQVDNVKKAALIVFLVSLTIETYQLIGGYIGLLFGRTFNVDDLILNTFGGVFGFISFELVKKLIKKKGVKEGSLFV